MKTRHFLIPLVVLALGGSAVAKDSAALAAARSEYQATAAKEGEAARVRYVTKLAKLLEKHVAEFIKTGNRDISGETEAMDAELMKLPAPASSDAAALSKLIVGKWQTPRHQFVYKSNGTWTDYPEEKGSPTNYWKIKGNQFSISFGSPEGMKPDTIVLLDGHYFIHCDKESVLFESRLK